MLNSFSAEEKNTAWSWLWSNEGCDFCLIVMKAQICFSAVVMVPLMTQVAVLLIFMTK